MSLHILPMLLALELELLAYRTNEIFLDSDTFSFAGIELCFYQQRVKVEFLHNLAQRVQRQTFGFFFSPAPLGKAKWLLSSICSISLIRLWGVHQGYGLQTLVSRTCSRWGSHLCFESNNNITGKTERLGHHTGKG